MNEKQRSAIIQQIRALAGQLGADDHPEQDGPSDAEHYDFQVMVGLALAVVEAIDMNPSKLFYWFGFCLIDFGLDGSDPRIQALMDALYREVESQLDALDEEKDAGDS